MQPVISSSLSKVDQRIVLSKFNELVIDFVRLGQLRQSKRFRQLSKWHPALNHRSSFFDDYLGLSACRDKIRDDAIVKILVGFSELRGLLSAFSLSSAARICVSNLSNSQV
ncbi:MAG: hypothetical protein IPJ30_12795 [Acidobacteria bacterium]|nr:hypothetical protein [Acidobacteriota bacterium]